MCELKVHTVRIERNATTPVPRHAIARLSGVGESKEVRDIHWFRHDHIIVQSDSQDGCE